VMFQSCDAGLPGYMVLFGTGKYLEATDLTSTDDQTMYGIWDFGDDSDSSEYLGAFTRPGLGNQVGVTLVEQTLEVDINEIINGVTKRVRVLTDNPMDWTTQTDGGGEDNPSVNAGWFFDLPESGERLTEAPGIRDGRLFFISWIPNADPCASGGDSIYHESNACTGGRVNDPVFDIRGDGTGIADGRVDEHDLITVTDASGNLISVSPTGIWHDRLMFVPRWVDDLQSDTAIGYAVDSQGNIIPIRDIGERLGINYWREW
ncbi:MAG: PilC/PilY family type IV pilus protein, partial [Thermodesulfobacteriota bacterium]|nr:PilC/PilY family type IV pilus protein [Thermodesulfobacteriota bacterium]